MCQEAGGHRIQRVPATETRGRVHSSMVTVVVLEVADDAVAPSIIDPGDVEIQWFNGTTKAGGQFRNKTATSCRLIHRPTGLKRSAQSRSRENSYQMALGALQQDVIKLTQDEVARRDNMVRAQQAGDGGRADRDRMWAFQRNTVEDFRSGRRHKADKALSGHMDVLWARRPRLSC